jgi:hypothetical protein
MVRVDDRKVGFENLFGPGAAVGHLHLSPLAWPIACGSHAVLAQDGSRGKKNAGEQASDNEPGAPLAGAARITAWAGNFRNKTDIC